MLVGDEEEFGDDWLAEFAAGQGLDGDGAAAASEQVGSSLPPDFAGVPQAGAPAWRLPALVCETCRADVPLFRHSPTAGAHCCCYCAPA
jgi:hypothetical protein